MNDRKKIIAPDTYFGKAISLDPIELYDQINRPTPEQVPYAVSGAIDTHFHGERIDDGNSRLLAAGVRDSQNAVINALRSHNAALDKETALSIAASEQTIATLSFLALQAEGKIQRINHPHLAPRYYRVNETEAAIMATDELIDTDTYRGCPHAKYDKNGLPSQLFRRFIKWSGSMAVEAYFENIAAKTKDPVYL